MFAQTFVPLYTIIYVCFGTPKTINFPFVPNGKLMVYRCPNTEALSIGTPKTIKFSFVPDGKLMVFRCPNIEVNWGRTILVSILITGHQTEKQ